LFPVFFLLEMFNTLNLPNQEQMHWFVEDVHFPITLPSRDNVGILEYVEKRLKSHRSSNPTLHRELRQLHQFRRQHKKLNSQMVLLEYTLQSHGKAIQVFFFVKSFNVTYLHKKNYRT
jgi:hypothetical protein